MPMIDLAPFGPRCTVHGSVRRERREGERLLFLFNETHDRYSAIRVNLLNACRLIDADLISCVGVEGGYDFADRNQADIEAKSQALLNKFNSYLMLIDHFIDEAQEADRSDPGRPHLYFGNCLKLLRPSVQIRCVEAEDLEGDVYQVQSDIVTKHALSNNVTPAEFSRWGREGINKDITDAAMLEFRSHPIHKQRDDSFLQGLLSYWQEVGDERAAILNAGAAHLDRIGEQVPEGIKFVQIYQP